MLENYCLNAFPTIYFKSDPSGALNSSERSLRQGKQLH